MATSPPLSSLPPEVVQQLLAGPAIAPPPGHVSNFGQTGPISSSDIIIVVLSEGLFLGLLAARLLVVLLTSRRLFAEDYVIIIAAIAQIGVNVSSVYLLRDGVGRHMWNITLQTFIDLTHGSYFFAIIYLVTVAAIKVAILLQFIHILAPRQGNKAAWAFCWASIFVVATFYATDALLLVFRCSPFDAGWNFFKAGHCLNQEKIYNANIAFGVISDIVLLIIPMPIILRLNMNLKKKLAIMAVFATGLMACTASIVRVYYNNKMFTAPDVSYYEFYVGLLCQFEILFGMLVFCAPMLPHFKHIVKRTWQNSYHSKSSSTGPSDGYPESVEISAPKASTRLPYDMPSLASFEEREASGIKKTTTTTMTTLKPVYEAGYDSSKDSGIANATSHSRW